MAYYRVYFMDRWSGHIEASREFTAEDDSAAIETAGQWLNGQPMELWERDRKVTHWEATSPDAPQA